MPTKHPEIMEKLKVTVFTTQKIRIFTTTSHCSVLNSSNYNQTTRNSKWIWILKALSRSFTKLYWDLQKAVFDSTKDIALLADNNNNKMVIPTISHLKFHDGIIMLSWLKKLLSFGQSAPAIIWEHQSKSADACSNKKRGNCKLLENVGWPFIYSRKKLQ